MAQQLQLPFERVAILGVGLLGGSMGLALRRAGFTGDIIGLGHRRASLDAAVEAGAIDRGTLDLPDAVAGADLVVLAGPIRVFRDHLAGCAHHALPGAILTDVGSTKRQVAAWAGELLGRAGRRRFVGSHPIAGSDRRGVQFARADLFDGACCVISPLPLGEGTGVRGGRRTGANRESVVKKVEALWRALGMWTVRMTPARHDRLLAEVSHLPHAAAAAMMLGASPSARELAGPGFIDATRIAGGDPELWRDIFLTNAPETVRAIKALSGRLARIAAAIERGRGPALVKLLTDAQRRRQALMERKLKREELGE